MKIPHLQFLLLTAGIATVAATVAVDAAPPASRYRWDTVANKNDEMPNSSDGRTYNSFNQPSVNTNGLVVFRARSRGGPPEGPPTRGIYTRDMSRGDVPGSLIETIAGGDTPVPDPNNLDTVFIEFPSNSPDRHRIQCGRNSRKSSTGLEICSGWHGDPGWDQRRLCQSGAHGPSERADHRRRQTRRRAWVRFLCSPRRRAANDV